MKKIIYLFAIIILAFTSNIAISADSKCAFNVEVNTNDSVKGLSIEKVVTILQNFGLDKPGEYHEGQKGGYSFYIKFLDINSQSEKIKDRYNFNDYQVSYGVVSKGQYLSRVIITFKENKSRYLIYFKNK